MPLSSEFDNTQALIAFGCGTISAFFHWVSTQTDPDRNLPKGVLRAQVLATFASGAGLAWLIDWQKVYIVDPLGAFCLSAALGFVYGPLAFQLAARFAAKKLGIEDGLPPADQKEEKGSGGQDA